MMKNYFLLMVMGAMLLYSCSDEAQEVITNPTSVLPSMKAEVDGMAWQTAQDRPPAGAYLIDSVTLSITGFTQADSTLITLNIKNPGIKNYTILDSASEASAFYKTNNAVSGSINVTGFTAGKVISGTFNFETDSSLLSKKYLITSGEFKNVPIGN